MKKYQAKIFRWELMSNTLRYLKLKSRNVEKGFEQLDIGQKRGHIRAFSVKRLTPFLVSLIGSYFSLLLGLSLVSLSWSGFVKVKRLSMFAFHNYLLEILLIT